MLTGMCCPTNGIMERKVVEAHGGIRRPTPTPRTRPPIG